MDCELIVKIDLKKSKIELYIIYNLYIMTQVKSKWIEKYIRGQQKTQEVWSGYIHIPI